ncbi:cell wall-binding repeat-containing protein [Candidatus Poriferisodalis sp.]|uniref:cell wall-binding repeat-containing protein n=1 Tax=Candidatus Poriferisodalis sp. TaxID=3101277 RepID=UPI003B5244D8
MNTRTKRRGRRSLAAIFAAMLMASVLAVVAGSPAQAANTSGEALVDTNDDGVPDAREFGGRDRYDTALRLATNLGKSKGLGNVPVAFVASGDTLVDSVSVSGLAGFLDAPVMLTPTESLHGGVADFIEDYGVDTIYVLGGSAAIADSVLEDIEALANEPTVTRIEGADRYATAAAVAAELGGGAAWCGGEDIAALLVNGGDVSLAEAMMVGPIAHRLQLPVLLTAADELPSATADFIEAEDIEHVVIVGGTDAVSEDVANAVSDAGVDTVDRIAGDTAAATSVALAGLLTGDCKDDLAPVSADTVALVHRDALPDGVAAAPVLASSYDGGDLVPILVVGDTLPASVRDYLAATPETVGGNKLNLSIVAIGGTAAVSSSVMDAAVAAAASADALTVQIGTGGTGAEDENLDINEDTKVDGNDAPQVDDTMVRLYFSDNVEGNDDTTQDVDELENAIRDILEINGVPARLSAATQNPGDNAACDADVVTVTLSSALKAGDTISIVGGAKLGSSADKRAVGGASVTVAAKPADRTRPSVSVILIAGQQNGFVSITDNGKPFTAEISAANVTVRLGTAATRPLGAYTDSTGDSVAAAGDITEGNIELDGAARFAANDRVTIAAGAVEDGAKNKSLQRSFTAIKAQASPRITSVLMSNLNHGIQTAQAMITVPTVLTGGTAAVPPVADDAPDIRIIAKSDGAAAGAAGNDWTLTFDRASTYNPEKDLDIDVRVNSRDKSVFVRFNNGKAKLADLQAALEANSAFSAMFLVKVDAEVASLEGGACGKPANTELAIPTLARGAEASTVKLAGGVTKAAIQVTFNAYISAADDGNLLADILAATAERVKTTDPVESLEVAIGRVQGALALTNPSRAAEGNVSVSFPGTKVTYTLTTSSAAMLPQVRDLVMTTGVALTNLDTTDHDDAVDVATGYAEDVTTGTNPGNVNENKNGASTVRISRSSSVKAPQ